jgi:hypothetical protein
MKRIAVLLAFSIAALAQQPAPAPTVVAGHQLGETFETWLAESGFAKTDLNATLAQCRTDNPYSAVSESQDHVEWYESCARRWMLSEKLSQARDNGVYDDKDGTAWRFNHGKLAWIAFHREGLKTASSLEDERAMLRQTYGKPNRIEKTVKQNGYGATFVVHEAWWTLPDGVLIHAYEEPTNDCLTVSFESAAWQREQENERKSRPNPYTGQ